MDKDRSEERNSGKGYKTTEGNGTKVKKQNITKKLFVCLLTSMLCFTYLSILDAGASRGEEEDREDEVEFDDGFLRYRVLNDHEVEVSGTVQEYNVPSIITVPEAVLFVDASTIYDVVSIGEEAFKNKGLQKIIAPSVKNIAYMAFHNNSITDVFLPEVTSLGIESFSGCYYLKELVLPELISIGDRAFINCSKLASLSSPKVTSIGNDVFHQCSSLSSLNFPELTSLGSGAFNNCSEMTDFASPKLTSIDNGTFSECRKMKNIEIPMVKYIGNEAFKSCNSLEKLNAPSLVSIGHSAFKECRELKNVSMPLVVSIRNDAFSLCEKLGSIDLPSLKYMGDAVFMGAKSLDTINIPNIVSIGKGAFGECSKLKNILIDENNKNYSVKENGAALFTKDEKVLLAYPSASGKYVVPGTVTTIGEYAFSSCAELTGIELTNVTVIGANAFYQCSKLVTVDAGLLEYIGDNAFSYCYELMPMDLTKVVYIGSYAFASWNVTTLELPSVKYIGDSSFCYSKVKTVNAPLATYIGGYAFGMCGKLETVNIPSAKYLGHSVFASCKLIEKIDVPNATFIGRDAFVACDGLKFLNLSSVENIDPPFFQETISLEILIIPKNFVYTGEGVLFISEKTIFVDGNVIVSAESNEGELTVKVSPKKGSTIENAELSHGENVIPSTEGFTWVFDGTVSNEYTIEADTADILVDVTISSSRGKGSFKYRSEMKGKFVDVPEDGVIRVKIGSTLEVKAAPEKGYVFKGWNDGSGRSTLVVISVDDNMSVSAKFKKVHSIKVSTENNGHIDYRKSGESRTRLPDDGSLTVEEDESVEIIAVAEDGYEFVGWVGGGTSPSLTISSLDEDIELTAIFKRISSSTGTGDDMFFTISTAALLLLAVLGIVLIYIRRR